MAVVRSPLMSLDARGKVAKAISFGHNRGRNVVRKVVKPHNPKSGLQTGLRAVFTFITQAFKSLTATQKADWKTSSGKKKSLPLNAMVAKNQALARRNQGALQDPLNVPGAAEAAPTVPAATAGTQSVTVTWTDSAGANDYCTFVYMSTLTGFTAGIGNLVAVIAHGVQKAVIPKLKTGTPYYFLMAGSDTKSVLSATTAQVTATPT